MTPKEKAIDIITKYQNIEFLSTNLDEFGEKDIRNMGYKRAKQCALIAVGEIIESTLEGINYDLYEGEYNENCKEFWQGVEQEMSKL